MWKAEYGKEPFDLRLTVLRLFRRSGLILALTAAGTLIFGGGYYVKNVVLQREPVYRAETLYRVEYRVAEEKDVSTVHINEMTWNTYVDTELFLDEVRRYLPGDAACTDGEMAEAINAILASNLKVLTLTVTTKTPEKSLEIAQAAQKAMTQDFPDQISEIDSVSVIDSAREAESVYPDVRPLRAVILSALLSCFFALTAVLLSELGGDGIWLPGTIRRRYGLKTVGTLRSPELAENMEYLFREKKRIAVCPVQEGIDPVRVLEELRKVCGERQILWEQKEWIPVPSPVLCPESCQALREADGILLAFAAGRRGGKQMEYTMEFLGQQDCEITGVILWDADEFLLNAYYGFCRRRENVDEG